MRLITVRLDVGIETESAEPVDAIAHTLAEDVEMQVPSLAVWSGDQFGPRMPVTRVAVFRASEQSQ